MHRDQLGIYLNDHLAGATFGVGLAQRIAHQHRHSARGADLQRICDEVAHDRQSLLGWMNPSCTICWTGGGAGSTRWRRGTSRQRRQPPPGRAA